MHKWTRRLLFSFQFLTRYPLNIKLNLRSNDYPRSSAFFPIVGVSVGAFCVLMAFLVKNTYTNIVIAASTVLGNCWITGAFHIDGLADTVDATVHHSAHTRLKSMKDSRVAKRGTIAIVCELLLRTFMLFYLFESLEFFMVLRYIIAVPVCGRLGLVAGAMISKSARPDGMGKQFIDGINPLDFFRASLIALPLLLITSDLLTMAILYGVTVAVAMVVVTAVSWDLGGGITGDTLGMALECCELAALLALVIISMVRGMNPVPFQW